MGRVLFAGDLGLLSYAGQIGAHVRPLDQAPAPGGPHGSELLFGIAAGPRIPLPAWRQVVLAVGPEVFGATAFASPFGSTDTAVEGLLSGRVEGTADDGAQMRVKVGVGAGLDARFGAPAWRAVVAVELFDHASDRDHDGVTDSRDACPDVPGVRRKDPKDNGCPPPPP